MNTQKLKLIPILGGLLALQLLLALALGLSSGGSTEIQQQSALIPVDMATIDRIRIEDGTKNTVTLQKNEQQKWQVSEAAFPADEEHMTKLLENLSGMQPGWPVGKTDDAAQRFKVAPEVFERKLALYQQEKVAAELFVGTAAAIRKSYVRLDGADEIHAGDINTYEIYSRPEEWIDKGILHQEPDNITSIRLPGLTLQRDEQGLNITGLKNDQQTNADEAQALVGKITQLQIQEILGTEAKPEYRQNKPSHTIGLTLKDGSNIDYTISQPANETYYVLKSSVRPEYFKVPTYMLDPIFNTKRDRLVEAKQQQSEENKAS